MIDVEARGLADFTAFFERLPDVAEHAAQLAVNDTTRLARRMASKQILDEINYPSRYLGGSEGRLQIAKFAKRGDLEGIVKGRDRATSLARFRMTPVRFGRQSGVRVQVARKGSPQMMKRAFFMRLRRGNSIDGENANVGLAVRVGRNETLRNSSAALELGNGLYLLYGPSVDQAFQGVALDIIDEVSDSLEVQFVRQFERLQKNG